VHKAQGSALKGKKKIKKCAKREKSRRSASHNGAERANLPYEGDRMITKNTKNKKKERRKPERKKSSRRHQKRRGESTFKEGGVYPSGFATIGK